MKNKIILTAFFVFTCIENIKAQCAMCKAAVEADLKEGGTKGAGLNEGILYLMAVPYIAVLIFAVFYYLQKRKKQTA